MKAVMQQTGRSHEACIASILELSIDQVPHETGDLVARRLALWLWLTRFGMTTIRVATKSLVTPPGYAIGTVKREDEIHHVVCLDGKIVFDPHPEQDSYDARPLGVLEYFVLINPATHWALGIESLYSQRKK